MIRIGLYGGQKGSWLVSLPRQPSQCLYVELHLTVKIPPCDGGYASSILVVQRILRTVNSMAECLFYIQIVGGSSPSPCTISGG